MPSMRLQVQCTPHRPVPSHRPASRPSRPRSPSHRRCPSRATRSSVGSSCGRAKSSRRPKRRLPKAAPNDAATVLQTAALPGPRRPAEAAPRPGQAPAGVAPCRRSTQQQRRSRACEHRPASASCSVGTRAAPPQPPHTLARAWSPASEPPEAPSGPAPARPSPGRQPLRAAASAPGPRHRSRRTRSPGHGRPPASHPKVRRVQLRPARPSPGRQPLRAVA